MIFVILGTQDKSFERLLKEIDLLIKDKIINKKVIVQSGSTIYKTKNMELIDYIPMNKFEDYIKKSELIITHGGVGSILDAIKHDKKVIAVPRLKKYNEHENDHQIEIVEKFDQLGYIIGCKNLNQLKNKIKDISDFNPKKYKSNNVKFINKIEDYIGE